MTVIQNQNLVSQNVNLSNELTSKLTNAKNWLGKHKVEMIFAASGIALLVAAVAVTPIALQVTGAVLGGSLITAGLVRYGKRESESKNIAVELTNLWEDPRLDNSHLVLDLVIPTDVPKNQQTEQTASNKAPAQKLQLKTAVKYTAGAAALVGLSAAIYYRNDIVQSELARWTAQKGSEGIQWVAESKAGKYVANMTQWSAQKGSEGTQWVAESKAGKYVANMTQWSAQKGSEGTQWVVESKVGKYVANMTQWIAQKGSEDIQEVADPQV